MIYSKDALALAESFEVSNTAMPPLTAYWDPLGALWTIAYGHTSGVKQGDICTMQQAVAWLEADLAQASACVNSSVTFAITQDEFDALVDFIFNLGCGKFRNSMMRMFLNAGKIALAAAEFDKWDHSGAKVVAGLLRRRTAEAKLFDMQGSGL